MYAFCIELISQTASFRNPEFQNFHKTLEFPPPTTIIGLVGAALGLSPPQAQNFFDQSRIKIGVACQNKGKTIDTWKYNMRTKHMHLYHPLLDGSVIKRELLIHNHFYICFYSEDEQPITALDNGFSNPFFTLTMGNSDALAKIKAIHRDLVIKKSNNIDSCLVAGDVLGDVFRNATNNVEFSIYQTSEPLTFDLPVRFQYQSDYGKRSVSETRTFSFIGPQMKLNYELEGVWVQDRFIPIFDL